MFEKFQGEESHCKILLDDIHIKLGVQFQGGKLLGLQADDPQKLNKIVLALMVASFVARLIPIFSLKAEFLFGSSYLLSCSRVKWFCFYGNKFDSIRNKNYFLCSIENFRQYLYIL